MAQPQLLNFSGLSDFFGSSTTLFVSGPVVIKASTGRILFVACDASPIGNIEHCRISNMEQKCKIKRAKILTKQHHILFSDFNDSIRNKVQSPRYKCELLSIYKLVFFKK